MKGNEIWIIKEHTLFGEDASDAENDFYEKEYYKRKYFETFEKKPMKKAYTIFVIVLIIATIVIAELSYLMNYKPSVIDPLEHTKSTMLTAYIVILLFLLGISVLINIFLKVKNVKNVINNKKAY